MPEQLKAAIDVEAALERPLGEISAAQFLQVLAHPKVSSASLGILADKKKYELWVEEGVIAKIPVGDIIRRVRAEKKKYELEPFPDFGRYVFPERAFDYGRLVEDIAARVGERLGR